MQFNYDEETLELNELDGGAFCFNCSKELTTNKKGKERWYWCENKEQPLCRSCIERTGRGFVECFSTKDGRVEQTHNEVPIRNIKRKQGGTTP